MAARTRVIFWASIIVATLLLSTTITAWPQRANPTDAVLLALAVAGLGTSLGIAARIIWVTQRQRR